MKLAPPLLLIVGSTILSAMLPTANGFCASTKIRRTTYCVTNQQWNGVTGFHGSSSRSNCPATSSGKGPLCALRRPSSDDGTGDNDYMKRLQEAARDPVAFEKFVMAKDKVVHSADNDDDKGTNLQGVDDDNGMKPSKQKGYQRIEEWDAQRTKDDMSWEERVQFEGRRFGNQYHQNEILRRNLKTF